MQTHLPALLFTHATRYATPFTTSHGQLCTAVPNGIDAHSIWPLRSHRFRDWLAHTFFAEHNVYPKTSDLIDAIRMLEAQAAHSSVPRHLIDRRLSHRGRLHHPDAIFLDLANEKNEAVEITPAGWSVHESNSLFQRSPNQQPLPTPQSPGSAGFPFDPLLPVATPAGRVQVIAWILAALRPIGPYPILILKGPPGSAKSTTARLLRALIDPVAGPFTPKLRNESALHRIAWNNRILAFDHVASIAPSQAESLTRLASGGGFFIPERHSQRDRIQLEFQRPIVLTVPDDCETAKRLPSSAYVVDLKLTQQRPEAEVLADFEQLRPLVLGSLLDATATALAHFDTIHLETDLVKWTTAAAPALALSTTDVAAALAPDPLITHVANFLAATPSWSGSTQELFEAISGPGLPISTKGLTRKLGTLNLAMFGIHLERWHTEHARGMRLTKASSSVVSEAHAA